MTSLIDPTVNAPRSSMPGWGIVADLTPPELIAARGLRTLRRALLVGLAVIVLVCAGGYWLARHSDNKAHDQLAAANSDTTQLMSQRAGFAIVTEVQSATNGIRSQLSSLFSTDIDVTSALEQVQASLPKGMSLTSLTVAPATPSLGADPSNPSLMQVGTVTMSGTAATLDALPIYVSRLGQLKSFTDIVPTTNTKASKNVSWTVTAAITGHLLSHRYSITGSK